MKEPRVRKGTSRARMGLVIVAALMIVFGLAEVVTGMRHEFFGLTTSQATLSTVVGMAIGALYAISGVLILTWRKVAAVLAIVFLGADVLGRILLILTGLYPTDSFLQVFAIVLGTAIAAAFGVYIFLNRRVFA